MGSMARVLLDNWWLKLLSLGLAYALWLAVAQAPLVDIDVSVPLELRNLSPSLGVGGELATRVRVHLRAPESLLREVGTGQIGVVVDLEGFAAGNHEFPLTAANVEAPPGIDVVRIVPDRVRVVLIPR